MKKKLVTLPIPKGCSSLMIAKNGLEMTFEESKKLEPKVIPLIGNIALTVDANDQSEYSIIDKTGGQKCAE